MAGKEVIDTVIKSYRDKLKINPKSLVFVQLADAYRKKGLYDEALDVCRDGLTRNSNLLSGLLMMGRVFTAKKDHGEAVDVLWRVVQREPGNLTAHALLSQAFMALGRYQDAIGEYQKILSLNPDDSAAQQALQAALEQMRRAGSTAKQSAASPSVAAALPAITPPTASDDFKPAASSSSFGNAVPAAAAPDDFRSATSSTPEPPGGDQEPALSAMTAVPAAPEIPAYAAAEELAERGLYDEAIEVFQRILEVDPDNFMARQKLREVYARREATESPVSIPTPADGPVVPVTTQADKISDDEILHLLGLMESGPAESAVAEAPPPVSVAPPVVVSAPAVVAPSPLEQRPPPPAPAVDVPLSASVPTAAAPLPKPEPAEHVAEPAAAPVEAPVADSAGAAPVPIPGGERIDEILNRLASTEGMRQAFLVAAQEMRCSGKAPDADRGEKIVTLVKMIAEITRKASAGMKQGEVKQVLIFGTEGMMMVSPAALGILAAVAGSGVKVGLLRFAINDCLKRLAEVS